MKRRVIKFLLIPLFSAFDVWFSMALVVSIATSIITKKVSLVLLPVVTTSVDGMAFSIAVLAMLWVIHMILVRDKIRY